MGQNRSLRSPAFGVWAILPCAGFFVLFALYPAVQLARLAFSRVSLTNGSFATSYAGLSNFQALGGDAIGADAVVNTLVFVVVSVPLTLAGGTLLAVLVDRARVLSALARRVLLMPMAIAPVVVSVVWMLLLDPSIGSVNKLFQALGLPAQSWLASPGGAMAAIIAVDVWHWTPLVFLLVFAALRGLDYEVLEAAAVDGASAFQTLRHITLPLLAPVIATAGAIRLVMCVKAFDEMYILTGGGPGDATTLVTLHIRSVFFDQLQFGNGAAYSLLIMLALALFLVAVTRGRRSLSQKRQGI